MKRSFRSELTEVVRHKGPVLKLANCVREGLIPCRPQPSFPTIKTPGFPSSVTIETVGTKVLTLVASV